MQITALTPVELCAEFKTNTSTFIPAFHAKRKRTAWYLPCLKIEDKPAFNIVDYC